MHAPFGTSRTTTQKLAAGTLAGLVSANVTTCPFPAVPQLPPAVSTIWFPPINAL